MFIGAIHFYITVMIHFFCCLKSYLHFFVFLFNLSDVPSCKNNQTVMLQCLCLYEMQWYVFFNWQEYFIYISSVLHCTDVYKVFWKMLCALLTLFEWLKKTDSVAIATKSKYNAFLHVILNVFQSKLLVLDVEVLVAGFIDPLCFIALIALCKTIALFCHCVAFRDSSIRFFLYSFIWSWAAANFSW